MGRRVIGPLSNTIVGGYVEGKTTINPATGAISLDLSTSNVFVLTLTGPVTISIVNSGSVGEVYSALIIVKNSNSRTITWPASVKWPSGAAPAGSAGATAIDVYSIMTEDGGTTYLGAPVGFNY